MIDNQRELYEDISARYRRLRPIRLRLNNELVSRLSRDALDDGCLQAFWTKTN